MSAASDRVIDAYADGLADEDTLAAALAASVPPAPMVLMLACVEDATARAEALARRIRSIA